jgi:hypothetical protein
VNYDTGADGWSGVDNFTGSNTPPPSVPETPPLPEFSAGSRIALIKNANVRQSASLSGVLLGTQATGATGTIIRGPILADNITWWEVNYDTGADGWSGVDNFQAISTISQNELLNSIGSATQLSSTDNDPVMSQPTELRVIKD